MEAADRLRRFGVDVQTVEADLATTDGADALYRGAKGRPIEMRLANAGHGLGRRYAFSQSAYW